MFQCHLFGGSLGSYNCSGGLARVCQVTSGSPYALCQPDSLALRPAKVDEPKKVQGFLPKKVGIKENPPQTKPPFMCCLPSLSSPPCHSPWPRPFPSLALSL